MASSPTGVVKRNLLKGYTIACVGLISSVAVMLGYDIGVMAGAIILMQKELGLSTPEKEVALGCLNFVSGLGAILTSELNEYMGSPKSMAWCLGLYVLGMANVALADGIKSLLFGRVVTGLGVGIGIAVCPQYIAEISPTEHRGVLVACFEVSLNIGLLLGYASSLAFYEMPLAYGWRTMIAVALPPAILCFVGTFYLPQSPRWLYSKGHVSQAEATLQRTCHEAEARTTFEAIKTTVAAEKVTPQHGWFEMLVTPTPVVRWALIIGLGTAVLQQANGSEAAVYYVPVVLQDAGVTELKMQLLGCLVVGLFKTMFVMVGQFNLDSYGRRPVLLCSIALVTVALGMLATNFTIHEPPAWLAMASLCTFVSAFSIGEGPVTWVLVAEIFPMSIRSKGTSLAMGLNRMMSGAIATLFLSMNQVLTAAGTFWLFSVVSLGHLYFTYTTVPETKGKTLEEIEAYLVKFASIPLQSDEHAADEALGSISPTEAGGGRSSSSYETFVDDRAPLLQGSSSHHHHPSTSPASMATGREPPSVKNRGGKLSV